MNMNLRRSDEVCGKIYLIIRVGILRQYHSQEYFVIRVINGKSVGSLEKSIKSFINLSVVYIYDHPI